MSKFLAGARKAVVAVLGLVAEALNAGLVHGTAAKVASAVIAAATAIGVYVARNATAATPEPSPPSKPAAQQKPATTKRPPVPTMPQ